MHGLRNAMLVTIVGVVATAAAALVATGQPKKEAGMPKPFKPVQPLEKLMQGQKKLYGEIKEGIIDQTWEEAETSAWLLAEIANVNHYQKDDPQYQKFAGRMSKDCVALAGFLKKQDGKSAREGVARVGRTCKACHDVFRKEEK